MIRTNRSPLLSILVLGSAILVVVATSASAKAPKHITPETRTAIDKGLKYLSRSQGRDGAWRNEGMYGRYPVAMTGLAGLALLMDGNTTTQGRYAPNVDRAAKYLLGSVTRTGLITRGSEDSRPMYGHGFSMLLLGQLYGMTESVDRQRELDHMLTRAIDLTAKSQSKLGGWFYTPQSRADEGSVTITQIQGLRACRNVGIKVNAKTIKRATEYVLNSQNEDGSINHSVGRSARGGRPALTAAGWLPWTSGAFTSSASRL